MMWPNLFERVAERMLSGRWSADELPPVITSPPPYGDPHKAQSLGMTETCAGYIVSGPKDHVIPDEYLGAHGFQVPFMQYKIADIKTRESLPDGEEGEICVRGYALMLGLHKRERHEYLDDDGWYYTGDKGSLRGPYIYFTGRVKELIKSSGANVAPREVEAVLNKCEGVLTSVVVGVPDPKREEIVGAAVVPRLGAQLDPTDLVAACKEALSPYKVPRRLMILSADDLPLLATGKTDLAKIKALLAEGARAT
jgi:acyl-CoA synthetase (AMP-forming)/AMP-acid ligase II